MIHFRIRDWLSILLYRLLAPCFGELGRQARIIFPLRIHGARFLHIGANATVQHGAYLVIIPHPGAHAEMRIGPGTMVGNHAHFVCSSKLHIGGKVLIADRVFISDNVHEFQNPHIPILEQGLRHVRDVTIGDGCWIGENVAIIGANIGRNCVIGANSVVTRDIADWTVAVGSPAVPIRRYCTESGSWRPTLPDGSFAA